MSEGRILIVEDDADTAEMLRLVFSEANFSVEVTSKGADALEYTRRHIPDLIILDIVSRAKADDSDKPYPHNISDPEG